MSLPNDAEIVAKGTWLYDGTAELPVFVIALAYDYWYELGKADDQLEPDEEPHALGPEGVPYYASFNGVNSSAYPTILQVRAAAQTQVQVPIFWSN